MNAITKQFLNQIGADNKLVRWFVDQNITDPVDFIDHIVQLNKLEDYRCAIQIVTELLNNDDLHKFIFALAFHLDATAKGWSAQSEAKDALSYAIKADTLPERAVVYVLHIIRAGEKVVYESTRRGKKAAVLKLYQKIFEWFKLLLQEKKANLTRCALLSRIKAFADNNDIELCLPSIDAYEQYARTQATCNVNDIRKENK